MGMMPPGSHGPVIWWGGWGRGRRKPDTGPANSGLTGDPAIEPPQQPEGPKDLRGRWESLKQSVLGTTSALPQVQLLVFALAALLNTLRNIFQQLLQNSVAMRIQLMVMEKAASLDLPFYEDPASYDLLRRAQNDSINRPVLMIATAFGLLQTVLTFGTMIVLLLGVSWILAVVVLIS